jgi:amidase
MTLPLHRSASVLPLGTQAIARFGDEASLFALAGQVERAQPWRRDAGVTKAQQNSDFKAK